MVLYFRYLPRKENERERNKDRQINRQRERERMTEREEKVKHKLTSVDNVLEGLKSISQYTYYN